MTSATTPFLLLFGASYFFAEFGPNTTTFVMAAECYPTSVRATGHGLSAGIAKLGAFIGVYLFPQISSAFGLAGALKFAAGMALIGTLLTLLLPEPSRRSLEDTQTRDAAAASCSPSCRRGHPGRLNGGERRAPATDVARSPGIRRQSIRAPLACPPTGENDVNPSRRLTMLTIPTHKERASCVPSGCRGCRCASPRAAASVARSPKRFAASRRAPRLPTSRMAANPPACLRTGNRHMSAETKTAAERTTRRLTGRSGALVGCCSEAVADRSGSGGRTAGWART